MPDNIDSVPAVPVDVAVAPDVTTDNVVDTSVATNDAPVVANNNNSILTTIGKCVAVVAAALIIVAIVYLLS